MHVEVDAKKRRKEYAFWHQFNEKPITDVDAHQLLDIQVA